MSDEATVTAFLDWCAKSDYHLGVMRETSDGYHLDEVGHGREAELVEAFVAGEGVGERLADSHAELLLRLESFEEVCSRRMVEAYGDKYVDAVRDGTLSINSFGLGITLGMVREMIAVLKGEA